MEETMWSEPIQAMPLTDSEKAEFKGTYVAVIKSIPLKNPDRKGYLYTVYIEVKEALKAAGERSEVNGDLECVYDLSNDRLIHIEHPELGLTEGLSTMLAVAKREGYDLFKRIRTIENSGKLPGQSIFENAVNFFKRYSLSPKKG